MEMEGVGVSKVARRRECRFGLVFNEFEDGVDGGEVCEAKTHKESARVSSVMRMSGSKVVAEPQGTRASDPFRRVRGTETHKLE